MSADLQERLGCSTSAERAARTCAFSGSNSYMMGAGQPASGSRLCHNGRDNRAQICDQRGRECKQPPHVEGVSRLGRLQP
jgi:hypothetical protein